MAAHLYGASRDGDFRGRGLIFLFRPAARQTAADPHREGDRYNAEL